MEPNRRHVTDCWIAVRDKDECALRAAFARGVPVDHPLDENRGDNALHFACMTAWIPGIELLLAAGADPRWLNKVGYTPLHSAAMSGERLPVEILLAQGVEVDARSTSGQTPLFVAGGATGDAIRALLAAGADPMVVCTPKNYSPIVSAALASATLISAHPHLPMREDGLTAFMEAGGEVAELLQTDAFWAEVRRIFDPQSADDEEALERVRRVVTSHVTTTMLEAAMSGGGVPAPVGRTSNPSPL